MNRTPSKIAAFLLFVVSAAHFARYFMGWKLIIHTFTVPVLWSLPIAIVLFLISIWLFSSVRR